MEHSKHYEEVLLYYERNTWSIERVRTAVGKWITAEEFEEITGQKWEE